MRRPGQLIIPPACPETVVVPGALLRARSQLRRRSFGRVAVAGRVAGRAVQLVP